MNKQELRTLLRTTYNRDNWKEALLSMFPDADMFALDTPVFFTRKEQRELAKHIVQFGEVELGDDSLIFLEVELKPQAVHLERNRVGLRKLVDNEVVAGLTDAALITYYEPETDEWRITFYSERFGWDEDGNTIKEETHPKRYTYVVGNSEEYYKTASDRLHKIIDKGEQNTLKSVLEAFSVQKVSKEFFDEYKYQYDKFVGYLTGKNWTKNGVKDVGDRITQFQFFFTDKTDPEKEARDFVKKLLGRIVFLHFVQKKQWLGASDEQYKDGDPNFIYRLFKEVPDSDKKHFYSNWLTTLFFDMLNTDDSHTFTMPDGSVVYIPFLNGGLFEKDDTDHNTESLPLPGELFSNPEDTESPNTRGFLDFLSAYNFTIHEDSPGDHTIAVDPEMLGHIFENLLEDNKDKGAYYTPKPIVHYMCQESLIEYLLTELTTHSTGSGQATDTGDSEKEELRSHLEDLIKKQEAGELVGFTEPILRSLKEVKVCDPAIGSGAFPMGILQEIYQAVETLHHLSPDNVQAIWELPDEDWHPAEVKKQIIQNSIYGVDIEKGAVDIARLRFWLSLIVDEEEPTALPNLDYKIVVGDSLVSKLVLNGQEKVVEINWEVKESVGKAKEHVENLRQTLDDIVNKQKDFFEADNETKKELREEIKKLKIDALIYQLKYDREYYSQNTEVKGGMMPTAKDKEHNLTREMQLKEYTNLIGDLEKVKENPEAEFQHFEWKLDFPERLNEQISKNSGFDIIIGNPPYLESRSSEFTKEMKDDLQQMLDRKIGIQSKHFPRGTDLMMYFFELSLSLINSDGIITLITQNSWLDTDYGKKFQDFIVGKTSIFAIIDSDYKYFDSVAGPNINTVITIFKGKNVLSNNKLKFLRFHENFERVPNTFSDLKRLGEEKLATISTYEITDELLKEYKWGLLLSSEDIFINLLKELNKKGKLINEISSANYDIGQGLNLSSKYVINYVTVNQFPSIEQALIPFMTNSDGAKFILKETEEFIIDKSKLSTVIQEELKKEGILLFDPNSTRKSKPTLILPRGIGRHFCAFNDADAFSSSFVDVYIEDDNFENILRLWCFLNSSILWLIREVSGRKNLGGGMLKAEATDLKSFPLYFDFEEIDEIQDVFKVLGKRESKSILNEIDTPEHKKIDEIVFNYLNIPESKRSALIELLRKKVDQRSKKSKTA
jgi:hypothetical protein